MGRARRTRMMVAVGVVGAFGLGGCSSDEADGRWRLASITADGESVDVAGLGRPLHLDIDDGAFTAESSCNTMSGEFGGNVLSTTAACGDELVNEIENHLHDAFRDSPSVIDERLVFDGGDVRLVYERAGTGTS